MMKKLLLVVAIVALAAGTAHAFAVGDSLILEARDAAGNQNPWWAPTVGTWAASGGKSTAPGLSGLGCYYGSTYTSIVGPKECAFTADLPVAGLYEVFTTYRGPTTYDRSPILHRVISDDGTAEIDVDQTVNNNTWVSLGSYNFLAGVATGVVEISNAHIDVSGNMWADSVKFTLLEETVIPEPGSLLVLGSGLAGLFGFIRRRSG